MVIDDQTTQINTFSGGMNTDASDAMLDDKSYRFAKNVRFVTETGSNTGELHRIEGVLRIIKDKDYTLLKATQCRDLGVLIVWSTEAKGWGVFSFAEGDKDLYPEFGWCCNSHMTKDSKLSVVTRYEDSDVQKLYIADGIDPILVVRLTDPKNRVDSKIMLDYADVNKISSHPFAVFKKPVFTGLISGRLKAGVVQYSYQFYDKHGKWSAISPATRLIPLYKGSLTIGSQGVEGYEQGTVTDKGVSFRIDVTDKLRDEFDHINIYRIQYLESGLLPTIELILSKPFPKENSIEIHDVGANALQVLTLEEYNSMTGMYVIPKVIETKNDYMFAGNIKDGTDAINDSLKDIDVTAKLYNRLCETYDGENPFNDMQKEFTPEDNQYTFTKDGEYYGGTGDNISWKFVISELTGDASPVNDLDVYNGKIGSNTPYITTNDLATFSNKTVKASYIHSNGELDVDWTTISEASEYFDTKQKNRSYANPSVAYYMKSLRRDELYRYGIVFFNEDGETSSAFWIADIRVPNMNWPGFNTFVSHGKHPNTQSGYTSIDLAVRPIGVEFELSKDFKEFLKSKGIVGYEIVRCARSVSDVMTLSQGVISRPVRRYVDLATDAALTRLYPLTPTGFLSIATFFFGRRKKLLYYNGNDLNKSEQGGAAFNNSMEWPDLKTYLEQKSNRNAAPMNHHRQNDSVFLFVSPEIAYTNTSFKLITNKNNLSLSKQLYLFGSKYNTEDSDNRLSGNVLPNDANKDSFKSDSLAINSSEVHKFTSYWWIYPGTNIKLPLNIAPKFGDIEAQNEYNKLKNPVTGADYATFRAEDPERFNTRSIGAYALLTTHMFYTKSLTEDVAGYDKFNEYWRKPNIYSYIKLYESSNTVALNDRKKNNFFVINGFDNLIKEKKVDTKPLEVDAIAFPETLKWNSFVDANSLVEDSKTSTSYSITAWDKYTTIGSDSYCNWVSGGLYGIPFSNPGTDNTLDEDGELFMDNPGKMGDTISYIGDALGPGGTTMLLSLKDGYDDIDNTNFTTTRYLEEGMNIAPVAARTNGERINFCYQKGEQNTPIGLYPESILGTYLCNLRQAAVPYGGTGTESKDNITYTSYGDYFDIDSSDKHVIFDGDCFIEPFEYVSMHKYDYSRIKWPHTACIVYAIPVETNMNLFYEYGNSFSKNILNGTQTGDPTFILETASDVMGRYKSDKDEYVYNQVYSQNPSALQYASHTSDNDTLDNGDYRVFYSSLKTNNENMDNWLKYLPSNFLDADSRYGGVTELREFKNQLVFWQEQATGVFSVNEKATITDQNNTPLILGTGGVMTRYDYTTTTNGMKLGDMSDAQSDTTLYWYDRNKNEICGYSPNGGVVMLSKTKSILNYMNELKRIGDISNKPLLYYDKEYNELLCNIFEKDGAIMYSEYTGNFVSSIDTHPAGVVITSDHLYIIKPNAGVYEWNKPKNNPELKHYPHNENGEDLMPYVDFVVNKNPQYTKVYDNGEISGKMYDGIENIRLRFKTPLKQQSELFGREFSSREYNFDYRIPRAMKDGMEPLFGDRLRGKNMHIELDTTSAETDFSLQWIITKYRISWT